MCRHLPTSELLFCFLIPRFHLISYSFVGDFPCDSEGSAGRLSWSWNLYRVCGCSVSPNMFSSKSSQLTPALTSQLDRSRVFVRALILFFSFNGETDIFRIVHKTASVSFHFSNVPLWRSVMIPRPSVNSKINWRIPLILQIIPPIVTCIGLLVVPESPRWLASHGRGEESLHVLKKIHRSRLDPEYVIARGEYFQISEQVQLDKTLR